MHRVATAETGLSSSQRRIAARARRTKTLVTQLVKLEPVSVTTVSSASQEGGMAVVSGSYSSVVFSRLKEVGNGLVAQVRSCARHLSRGA